MKSILVATDPTPAVSREKYLEAFLADTASSFMIVDTAFHVVFFSSSYGHFHYLHTGTHLKEGRSLNDLLPAEGMAEIMPYLQKALGGEEARFAIQYPHTKGTNHKFEMHYLPLINDRNECIGVKMFVYDKADMPTPIGHLRSSDDLFKTLIQNTTDAFQLTDVDFEIQYVSDSVQNLLGYTTDELVGTNGVEFIHPDDREQVLGWFKTIRREKSKPLSTEYRIKNKVGDYIWIGNHSRNMLDNPEVKSIVMSFRNIQLQKAADLALVQAEQRLSLLLNNTEESFIILNSRLKVTAYNRAAQEHSPYFFKQELQSDLSILDLVNADEVEAMINLFEKVFDGEQVERETEYADENKLSHIFSHTFRPLFNDQKDIFGVFITSADITKRKLAERQVNESEIRFKTIISESFDAIMIANNKADIFYTSPSISNVVGYTSEEMMGLKGLEYIHPDDLSPTLQMFDIVASNEASEKSIDLRMLSKKGEKTWVEARIKNMSDNPYVQGILISLRNITARKKAEEMISLSELRFKGLVQSGTDVISIVDENALLQYASPNLENIIGMDPSIKYGQNIFNYIHAEDIASVKEKFDSFLKSGEKQMDIEPYRVSNGKGQYLWIESTVSNLLSDLSIKGIVFNTRDVTERKRLTENLAANTERLKSAQKIAKLGYLEYDLVTGVFFCSNQFYDILGIVPENHQLTFSTIENAIDLEDRDRFKKQLSLATIGMSEFNDEYALISKDGSRKVVLALGGIDKATIGTINKFSLTFQDITESKMATIALQTMEDRFRSIFENSIDGVIISVPSGDILSANPALRKMVGYNEQEITVIKASDLLDKDSPAIIRMREERNRTGFFTGEISIRHKTGHYIPAEVTSINMTDAHGELYHSTIVRDITEKKKIEIEQQSLTEELVKNNQDLQQFSFITSHNLRAPVANLISLLSLYNRQDTSDEFNPVLIDKFEEATLQLNQTLNDLIDVLVIKSNTNVEKEILHFSDIFCEVKTNIGNLLNEQNGEIDADFTAIDTIEYNKIHLDSIFLNLVTNAIRYRSPDRAPHIKLKSYKQGEWAVVSFEDNGLGIDLKRYGDRMFGLYQRFHNSKEGKGLGLYMVKSQIMAMGGKIEVNSEPGKGTTFKVYFKL